MLVRHFGAIALSASSRKRNNTHNDYHEVNRFDFILSEEGDMTNLRNVVIVF